MGCRITKFVYSSYQELSCRLKKIGLKLEKGVYVFEITSRRLVYKISG